MSLQPPQPLPQPPEIGKRAILPFALMIGKNGTQEFPQEMTIAAILADVEKHRAKAGLIRKAEERVAFLSTIYWPIVIVPWREGRNLVFDGMAVWSYVFEDHRIPNTEAFVRALAACRGYKDFLGQEASHETYFKEFMDVERLPVMGLFIHEEFMKDMLEHIALARPREVPTATFLESRLPMAEARNSVARIANISEFGRKELQGLARAKDELRNSTERFRGEVDRIIEDTRQKYQRKIDAIKPDVTAKVAQLEKKREEMWQMMQPRLLSLQAEVRRLESEESHWARESKRKEAGEEAVSRARDRLSGARRDLERAKGDTEKYQDEMAQSRAGYDKQIQDQWERIRSLERERDAEIGRLQNEQREMTQRASMVFQDMEGLKKRKEEEIAFIESQGVQVPAHLTSDVIYMPLMMCQLHGEKGARFMVYPPMIAKSGKGMLGGIQSMFGGLVLPLEPKTKQFDEVFRIGIEKALTDDSSLATYIGSMSMSANVLHDSALPAMIMKGLAEMKNQGWIKDKHEKELLQSLQKHIEVASQTAPK